MVRLSPVHLAAELANDRVRTEVTASGLVPLALLVLLVGLLVVALVTRDGARRGAAWLLLPVSAAWVVFNGPLEGPILLTFSPTHGVTASDLLAVAGVLVALSVLAREHGR